MSQPLEEVEQPDFRNTPLGLRVKRAAVKESDAGEAKAEITIVGEARNMVKLVGESIRVATMDNGRAYFAHVRAVTVATAKEEGKRTVTLKASGARELDQLVGCQVTVEKAQGELPGVEPSDPEAEPAAPRARKNRARGKDAAAGERGTTIEEVR